MPREKQNALYFSELLIGTYWKKLNLTDRAVWPASLLSPLRQLSCWSNGKTLAESAGRAFTKAV